MARRSNNKVVTMARKMPRVRRRADQTVFMTGTEPLSLVSTIAGLSGFTRVDLRLPNSSSLSRLSALGANWSEYRWKYLKVRYESFSGDNQPGRFAIGALYDINSDVTPTTINQIIELTPSLTVPVSKTGVMHIPCGTNEFQLNWYPVASATGTDTLIPVSVYFATDQGSASINVGELYLDYGITFKHNAVLAVNP